MTPLQQTVARIQCCSPACWWIVLFGLSFCLHSCANYRPHYHTSVRDWPRQDTPPKDSIAHRIFLLGDLGSGDPGDSLAVLDVLASHLHEAPARSSLVLLGDLVAVRPKVPDTLRLYPLQRMLAKIRDFRGRLLVVHGERDWAMGGIAGLDSLQALIRTQLPDCQITFTEPGCGDLVEVALRPDLSVVLLDSPWWLADWTDHPRINSGCEAKSRKALSLQLEELLKKRKSQNLLIAMHHPLHSGGPYGGSFPLKKHLFPLTDLQDNLWIPLPLLGSLYPLYRSTIGGTQDLAHYRYKELAQTILPLARASGPFVFAAAHEHGLQYFHAEQQHFIGSGSATRASPLHRDRGARFTYGRQGFAELQFLQDGSVWLFFRVPEAGHPRGKVVFRKRIKGALSYRKEEPPPFDLYESGVERVRRPISQVDFSHSRLGGRLWGENYRELYNHSAELPVLDLHRYRGGVTPLKLGGGYTTNTLKLLAPDGRQYIMRSVEKDPSRTLPYPFNKTFAIGVIRDQFSGIHPYAALPLPALSEAAGILHTNPKLYYVPRQPGLAPYNNDLGDAVYLLEERPDDNWEDAPHFASAPNIVGTQTLYDRLVSDGAHHLDQRALARARLFDLLIGDWDRDSDQWRWAELPRGEALIYKPIPRDRDQAFSRFKGFYLDVLRFLVGPARQFGTYGPSIPYHIRWSAYSALDFDRTFLTELEWADWQAEARRLQHRLTDSVIDRAFAEAWPSFVQAHSPKVVENLKKRCRRSLDLARRFYEHVSRLVDVKGSLNSDRFVVDRLPDGRTRVQAWQSNESGPPTRFFDRTFLPKETREIRLYGLAGADTFILRGQSKRKASILRLIGGLGRDTLRDASGVRGWRRRNIYYDFREEDKALAPGPETRIVRTDDPRKLTYDRLGHDYAYNRLQLLPDFGFNPDDGIFLGISSELSTYGFQKAPFSTRHQLNLRYAIGTNGFLGSYRATLVDVLGKWELFFDSFFSNFLYTNNFYGFGNDTPNPEEALGLEYNRVRMRKILLFPALMKQRTTNSLVAFGPLLESVQVAPTGDRFIDEIAGVLGPNTFGTKTFLGPRLLLEYDNYDDEVFRTSGIAVFLDAGWRFQLERPRRNYPYFSGHVAFYYPLDAGRRLILGTRIGGIHLFARPGEFEFYHAATLGGLGPQVNLRGFRRDRFAGRSAFFQNLGLQYKLFEWKNPILPLSGGLTAGLDYGRVWMPDTPTGRWHVGYGGGFFLNPLDLLSFRAGLFRGDRETTTFAAALGFFF